MNNTNMLASKPNIKDRVENFNGKQILYVGWDHHTMICAPIAFLIDPTVTFQELIDIELNNSAFTKHPDYKKIDWTQVQWYLSDTKFSPDLSKSISTLNIKHKDFVRISTPDLNGIAGSGS
ncbi:phenol hydroxylase subunit P4 [Ampullimonas aquatilis]|uniref:phenol hydroxylase subunit P4 n=1 Tax=Ampullimonas aquatilis TaxID=1341549 RepID=UPI003C736A16